MDDTTWSAPHKRLIYSLRCPVTKEVHYVGKTTTGMLRPLSHLTDSHSEKVRKWVSNLKELGYRPVINVLEYVAENCDLDERERYWISYCHSTGCLLLNSILVTPLLVSPDYDMVFGEGDIPVISTKKIVLFIKERRKRAKLTQPEFAAKCGIGLRVLRKIEHGDENFRVDILLKILKMFGYTIDVAPIRV